MAFSDTLRELGIEHDHFEILRVIHEEALKGSDQRVPIAGRAVAVDKVIDILDNKVLNIAQRVDDLVRVELVRLGNGIVTRTEPGMRATARLLRERRSGH